MRTTRRARRITRAAKIIQDTALNGMGGFIARVAAKQVVQMIERSMRREDHQR